MPRATRLRLLVGASLWAGLLFHPTLTVIPRVLLLAVLVVVPLALWLLDDHNSTGPALQRLYLFGQALAALLATAAFLRPAGGLAGGLALGWLALTGVVAVQGLVHLRRHRLTSAAEVCLGVGQLYLLVGGVWLAASRFGLPLLGFNEPLVSLTAAHFHYAGFAALLITGFTGRWLAARPDAPRTAYRLMAMGLTAGMMLVAAGITFSPVLEVVAAVVFAASLAGLAVVQLRYVVPRLPHWLPRMLMSLSALLGGWAMGAAVLYAVSEYTQTARLSIPQMLRVHGEVNALGFVLLNLLAWGLLRRPESGPAVNVSDPGQRGAQS